MFVNRNLYFVIDEPHWLGLDQSKSAQHRKKHAHTQCLLLLTRNSFVVGWFFGVGKVDIIEFVVRAIIWSIVW